MKKQSLTGEQVIVSIQLERIDEITVALTEMVTRLQKTEIELNRIYNGATEDETPRIVGLASASVGFSALELERELRQLAFMHDRLSQIMPDPIPDPRLV